MPLYEYKCDSCGSVFEVIQKFADQPLQVHENCGGAVKRLISSPAFHFKGTGWYVTDYARKGANGGAGSTSPSSGSGKDKDAGKSSGKDGAKSDPAPKTEAKATAAEAPSK